MRVTVNTDASFKEFFGGFAFWIVCDAGKIQKAGKIKEKVTSSSHAEMMCIANALHTLKNSRFTGLTSCHVNTDNKQCIDLLTRNGRSKSTLHDILDECHFLMMEICLKNGFSIRDIDKFFTFKHVKAHNGKSDSRSYVNDWCDKEAKKYCKLRLQDSKAIG